MQTDDASYYWRRANEEQIAAQRATCPVARDRHHELATMYRFRSAMLTKKPLSWPEALEHKVVLA